MIATWLNGVAHTRAIATATIAISRRHQSGVSVRAFDQTAWATTATAASLRP